MSDEENIIRIDGKTFDPRSCVIISEASNGEGKDMVALRQIVQIVEQLNIGEAYAVLEYAKKKISGFSDRSS